MGILTNLEQNFRDEEVEQFLHFFRVLCDNFEPAIIKISKSKELYKEGLRELDTLSHNLQWAAKRLELTLFARTYSPKLVNLKDLRAMSLSSGCFC